MILMIFKSFFSNPNITYEQATAYICGCDNNNNKSINFSVISQLIDTFRFNNSNFSLFKAELISKNTDNKILLEDINTISEFSEGSVFLLDTHHVGITHVTDAVVDNSMHHTKLSVFEMSDTFNLINIIQNSYDYILELISKSNAKLIDYPKVHMVDAVDRESYNSYREYRMAIKAERQSLILAKLKMVRAMASIGNKIASHHPEFNLEIFNQAIFLNDISPEQAIVINQAFEYISFIT